MCGPYPRAEVFFAPGDHKSPFFWGYHGVIPPASTCHESFGHFPGGHGKFGDCPDETWIRSLGGAQGLP